MKSIVLRDKIYIPIKNEEELERLTPKLDKHFRVSMFDDKNCEACELINGLGQRPIADCYECPSMKAQYKLWSEKVVKGDLFVGFPYGKKKLIPKIFPNVHDMPQKDMTPDIDFKSKLRFTGELREHQTPAVNKLIHKANSGMLRGVLLCPPRVGKTVMSVALICALKKRALILTNQHDLCKQFYDTFYGSENQPALTNASKIKSVVMATKLEDFFEGDVVIATYQKFISELGKERLKKISSLFSILVLDEVHRVGADSFLKVVSALNTKHKLGLTATFGRKDGRDELVSYVLGKPIVDVKIETLVPELFFHETGLHSSKDYSLWVYYIKWLARDKKRQQMIIDQACEDIKNGHSIVIPCYHLQQVYELVRKINWQMGKNVAAAAVGGSGKGDKLKRDEIFEKAKSGEIKCVVGIRKIVSTGINVAKWSALYWIDPLANPPNWIQEYSRILTPLPNKKPIIRFFLDDSGQTIGCLKSCLFKTEGDTEPLFKKAIIKPDQWSIANKYIKKRKGERIVPESEKKQAANQRSTFLKPKRNPRQSEIDYE